MKGRIWLLVGAVVGVAISIGKVKYLAGAARTLADTAQRVVGTGGSELISTVAHDGAPHRVVLGITAVVAILVPGLAALLFVIAARSTLRLRAVIALALAVLGAVSFAYVSHGHALGVLVLALVVAAAAVVLTGPLVAAPLCALAGLIGGEFLPGLLSAHSKLPNRPVAELHQALFASAGAPLWLRVVVLIVAVVPFAIGARLVLKS